MTKTKTKKTKTTFTGCLLLILPVPEEPAPHMVFVVDVFSLVYDISISDSAMLVELKNSVFYQHFLEPVFLGQGLTYCGAP